MSIYEKSTNQLLTEYIKANLKPSQIIDKDKIVDWFKSNYPKIKSNTVMEIPLKAAGDSGGSKHPIVY